MTTRVEIQDRGSVSRNIRGQDCSSKAKGMLEPFSREHTVGFILHSVLLTLYVAMFWHEAVAINECPHKDRVLNKLGVKAFGGRWKFLTVIDDVSMYEYTCTVLSPCSIIINVYNYYS